MKHFPRGACFAFSGLFFALTLLVLFQSKEPFGLAALVAYVACLSLTILLFSAPYFAGYFINYYRKLHQIEEAILLISEQRQVSPSKEELHPPYSAVSIQERTDAELGSEFRELSGVEQGADSETESNGSGGRANADPEVESPPVVSTPESEGTAGRRRRTQKAAMLESQDEFQMSLFFPGNPGVADAEPSSPDASGEAEEVSATTAMLAYCLLDEGNTLFVRGDPPLSWEQGTPMASLEVGKHQLELLDLEAPIEVCFLINDDEKRMSAKWEVSPDAPNECYPEL